MFYRASENASGRFPAEFDGKYFFADFMAGWIRVLDPDKPETSAPFAKRVPGPADLAVEKDGSLLVLVRNAWVHDDKLKRQSSSLVRIRAVR